MSEYVELLMSIYERGDVQYFLVKYVYNLNWDETTDYIGYNNVDDLIYECKEYNDYFSKQSGIDIEAILRENKELVDKILDFSIGKQIQIYNYHRFGIAF